MIQSIELQVISRLLTTEDKQEIETLLGYDESYYSVFTKQIDFIQNHYDTYKQVPDIFTYQAEFPNDILVSVDEPLEYLQREMRRNKQHILLMEAFNKIKDLGTGDTEDAWRYLDMMCEKAAELDELKPMDIIHQAEERADQIIEFGKQQRIPTGFAEIDKLMYGGLSTVEELLVIIARSNAGKTWLAVRMMESAQKNGFPVAYYSPEMQSSFIGTRFDTWRGHFENSQIFRGKYSEEYLQYIKNLQGESTSAFIIEDKDMEDNTVSVRKLRKFVKKHGIKLLIIDGISYMEDDRRAIATHEKYKNIASDLFQLSKQYGCAVVLIMQANRETKDNVKDKKDDKGMPLPQLHNAEGSDHPGRIATQVFGIRQIYDKHILEIGLLKSRNAMNQQPVLSYRWDVNTGDARYSPEGTDSVSDDPISNSIAPPTVTPKIISDGYQPDDVLPEPDFGGFGDDEEVEF